jgi:hypothetical protein
MYFCFGKNGLYSPLNRRTSGGCFQAIFKRIGSNNYFLHGNADKWHSKLQKKWAEAPASTPFLLPYLTH